MLRHSSAGEFTIPAFRLSTFPFKAHDQWAKELMAISGASLFSSSFRAADSKSTWILEMAIPM
jgi:hypothetical protein